MDKALINLRGRRSAWWIGSGVAAVALVAANAAARTALLPAALWTGVLLYGLVLALALFNARKKLPFLPLTRASTWPPSPFM